jgi:hypothetical protein
MSEHEKHCAAATHGHPCDCGVLAERVSYRLEKAQRERDDLRTRLAAAEARAERLERAVMAALALPFAAMPPNDPVREQLSMAIARPAADSTPPHREPGGKT